MKSRCYHPIIPHPPHPPRPCKPRHVSARKVMGLITFSAGLGMLTAMLIPAWGILFAALMTIFGFWNLFM
ncbi:MAG: hypothetical protein LBM16_02380 [Clostridiales bacterium]|nr:hypothetical protein [Clostridiales bacterium]